MLFHTYSSQRLSATRFSSLTVVEERIQPATVQKELDVANEDIFKRLTDDLYIAAAEQREQPLRRPSCDKDTKNVVIDSENGIRNNSVLEEERNLSNEERRDYLIKGEVYSTSTLGTSYNSGDKYTINEKQIKKTDRLTNKEGSPIQELTTIEMLAFKHLEPL